MPREPNQRFFVTGKYIHFQGQIVSRTVFDSRGPTRPKFGLVFSPASKGVPRYNFLTHGSIFTKQRCTTYSLSHYYVTVPATPIQPSDSQPEPKRVTFPPSPSDGVSIYLRQGRLICTSTLQREKGGLNIIYCSAATDNSSSQVTFCSSLYLPLLRVFAVLFITRSLKLFGPVLGENWFI